MSATALRRCDRHILDKTFLCRRYLRSFRACILDNRRRNNLNLRCRSRVDNHRTTAPQLVQCQTQGRRNDSQHSQAYLARAIQLQSCRESLSCQEKRRRRRKLRDTPANLCRSLSRHSNGHRQTPTSSAHSSPMLLQVKASLRADKSGMPWTHDSDLRMDHRKCIRRVRRVCNNQRGTHNNSCRRRYKVKCNQDTYHNSRDQLCSRTKVPRTLGRSSWLKNSEQNKLLVSHHGQSTRILIQWVYPGHRANSRNNQAASLSNVRPLPMDTTIPRSPHQSRVRMALLMRSNSALCI